MANYNTDIVDSESVILALEDLAIDISYRLQDLRAELADRFCEKMRERGFDSEYPRAMYDYNGDTIEQAIRKFSRGKRGSEAAEFVADNLIDSLLD